MIYSGALIIDMLSTVSIGEKFTVIYEFISMEKVLLIFPQLN